MGLRSRRLDRPINLEWHARMAPTGLFSAADLGLRAAYDALERIGSSRLRIGVTGLSRSGKTVFLTALVHALTAGGRLPAFAAAHEGRILRAALKPQPDDTVPRFPYEANLAAITGPARSWPDSTRRISELRIEIAYESRASWLSGEKSLTLDLVDYPGEWLLDLPLLDQPFRSFCRTTLEAARAGPRLAVSQEWRERLAALDPAAPADEALIGALSDGFKRYLNAARAEPVAMSLLPPGRFLMPGDLAGSPALTFSPLDFGEDAAIQPGSLAALMERRYEAYRQQVVWPFFRDHFARLDRQIVLIDALTPLNAGPAAVADLEHALDHVLGAFRIGRNSWLSGLFAPRADKVLFAAAKADLLHHSSHDRLEAIVALLVDRALRRASGAGATVETTAIAAVRATREAILTDNGRAVPTILGTPEAGERIDDALFDGLTDGVIDPGELPATAQEAIDGGAAGGLHFVRFRPPPALLDAAGRARPLPHIRLDRAIQFLIGDRLA